MPGKAAGTCMWGAAEPAAPALHGCAAPNRAGCSPALVGLPQIPVDEWGRLVVLGEGSTATVYLAKLQGHYVALKVRLRAAACCRGWQLEGMQTHPGPHQHATAHVIG